MAIVPPPSNPKERQREPLMARPVMALWVRGALVGVALGLTALFTVAALLNPYLPDGSARRMETHRQLGLPECTFKHFTGYPCPSCGMTTSFALTIRGDLYDAVRANSVGALLALLLLVAVPWCAASAFYGRTLFIRSVERTMLIMVLAFLALMLLRWALVIGLIYGTGAQPHF